MLRSSIVTTTNAEISGGSIANSLNTLSTIDINSDCHLNYGRKVKIYKRRFWILSLYSILAILANMLNTQYIATANLTGCYYGVTQEAVNWTIQIFLLVYVILVLPASLVMDYMDIRWTVICGSVFSTIACILQFFTLKPDGFVLVMISSFFGALADVFIIGISPHLAARWFPSNELSRANSFGILGIQIGVTIGFIFSPLMVNDDCSLKNEIEEGKRNVAFILTALNAIVLILLLFTFQNAPEYPPNVSQLEKKNEISAAYNLKVIIEIMKQPKFILIFLLSGLMAGSFFAFTTTNNDLMIRYFPKEEVKIAWMSTFFALMGVVGSVVFGYVLDYTHKFKEVSIIICLVGLVFYVLFCSMLTLKKLWVQFIFSGVVGFFVAGFLPVGIEYGVEIIFPDSELISSNLQFLSVQAFAIVMIQIVSHLLDSYGPMASCIAMGVNLLICLFIACFLTKDYKRSKKHLEDQANGII